MERAKAAGVAVLVALADCAGDDTPPTTAAIAILAPT
jgi:hypothetical protein